MAPAYNNLHCLFRRENPFTPSSSISAEMTGKRKPAHMQVF